MGVNEFYILGQGINGSIASTCQEQFCSYRPESKGIEFWAMKVNRWDIDTKFAFLDEMGGCSRPLRCHQPGWIRQHVPRPAEHRGTTSSVVEAEQQSRVFCVREQGGRNDGRQGHQDQLNFPSVTEGAVLFRRCQDLCSHDQTRVEGKIQMKYLRLSIEEIRKQSHRSRSCLTVLYHQDNAKYKTLLPEQA